MNLIRLKRGRRGKPESKTIKNYHLEIKAPARFRLMIDNPPGKENEKPNLRNWKEQKTAEGDIVLLQNMEYGNVFKKEESKRE